jgi:hypothetical protein
MRRRSLLNSKDLDGLDYPNINHIYSQPHQDFKLSTEKPTRNVPRLYPLGKNVDSGLHSLSSALSEIYCLGDSHETAVQTSVFPSRI